MTIKRRIVMITAVSVCFFVPSFFDVFAHPGRTDSKGGHTCRTNCSKWGLSNGEYHYHNDGGTPDSSSGSNSGSTSDSSSSYGISTFADLRSGERRLFSLTVNGDSVQIADTMAVTVKDTNVSIEAQSYDDKADVEIENIELVVGKNQVKINVTAENGQKKTYRLNITVLDHDNYLKKLTVNGEELALKEYIIYDFDGETFEISVITNSPKADYSIDEYHAFSEGDNEIKIKVRAENDRVRTYTLNVYVKSNNSKLGELIIDGDSIELAEYMEYETSKDRVELKAITSHPKATTDFPESIQLNDKEKVINIIVNAENGINNNIYHLKIIKKNNASGLIAAAGIIGTAGVAVTVTRKKKRRRN